MDGLRGEESGGDRGMIDEQAFSNGDECLLCANVE